MLSTFIICEDIHEISFFLPSLLIFMLYWKIEVKSQNFCLLSGCSYLDSSREETACCGTFWLLGLAQIDFGKPFLLDDVTGLSVHYDNTLY